MLHTYACRTSFYNSLNAKGKRKMRIGGELEKEKKN